MSLPFFSVSFRFFRFFFFFRFCCFFWFRFFSVFFPFLSVSFRFLPFSSVFFRFLPFFFFFPFSSVFFVFFRFLRFIFRKKRGDTVRETPFAKRRLELKKTPNDCTPLGGMSQELFARAKVLQDRCFWTPQVINNCVLIPLDLKQLQTDTNVSVGNGSPIADADFSLNT